MKALTALTGLFLLLWCSLSEAASRTDNPITFRFHCRKDGCCDHHEWCRFWASVGECKTNSEWMNDNCQLSCGTCGHPLSNRPKSTQAKQPRRPTHAQMSKPAHSKHVTHATQAPRPAHVTHASRPAHVTHARRPVHVTHATHAPRPHVTPRPHLAPQPLRTHTNRRTRPHRPVHTTPKPTRRPVTHRRPAPRARVTRPPHSVRPHFLTALRTRGRSRGFSHHIPSRVIVRPSTFAPATTSTTVAPTTTTTPSPTVAPTTTTMPTTTTTPSTTVAPSTTIAPTTTSTSTTTTTTTTTTTPLTTTTTVPATTRPSHTFIVHVTRPVHRQRPTVRPAPRTTPRPTTTTTPRTTTRTTTRATTTTTTRAPTTRHVDTAKDRRCREIISDPLVAAEELLREKLIESTEKNDDRRTIDLDQVIRSNIANACVPRLDETSCEQNMCYNAYFRTMDGTCNNLQHPLRGASYRPYTRLLPTVYDNDLSEPVGSLRPELRPSPREITRELTSSDASVESSEYNALIMQFGQFTSHDLAKTTLVPSSKCNVCQNITSRCMSVPVLADDPNTKFKQTTCIRVSRSSPICGSGNLKPRQQLNENTGYIDASPIYGSSVHDSMKFRDGKTGFLKLPSFRGLSTLPFDQSRCNGRGKCTVIFTAGDSRVNLFVGLSAWHTIFTREHNRIATALQRLNPHWDGERLYHETRKIIGAEMQAVVYREWLPKVLGASFAAVVGDYQGYDPNVDSTVANEFTSAAFRFGHGMIQEVYQRLDANFRNISFGALPLQAGTLKSDVLVNQGGPDPILRGLFSQPVKRPQRITKAVTENMFRSTDLSSINIQRGRDHGHQSYTKYRELCGMGTATNFEHLSREILNTGTRQKLQRVYGNVDRIDLWVGALLEDPVVRGLVGPTVACIIGPQFKRTRDGDRFYYENPGVFTRRQLSEIRKSSLSRILCDNGQTITMVPREAFRIGHLTPCNQIPQMDLSKWKE